MSDRRDFLKTIVAIPAISTMGFPFGKGLFQQEKNKYSHKFKISLNVFSFNDLLLGGKIDLFNVLDFCARYNFDAIDPTGYYFPGYPEVPTNEHINRFKKEAFKLGLDISGTGVRNDFAQPDPAKRKADLAMIKQWIEAAAKLGIPNLRVFAGTSAYDGFTRDQVFQWMAKDLKECCSYGKEFGVIISIQNHNDFLKTAGDVFRIFEMVNSEWLGLNLDIGSYRTGDPYDEIEQTAKLAVTWQIKENVFIKGKETKTDFVKLIRMIKQSGYRGYLPLETLGEGDPFVKIPKLLNDVQVAINLVS